MSEGSQTQIFLVRRFDVRPGRFLRARSNQCRVQGVAVASLTPSHSGREKDRAWGHGWKWQQLTWPRPHIPHASSRTYRLLLVGSIAKVTGERTWEPWFQHESKTTPGRWSCGTGPCLLLYVSICHVLMFPVSRSPFVWICILFYSFLYVHHPLWKFLSGSTTSMLWQGIRSGNRPRGDGRKWFRQGNRRFDFAWKPFGIPSFLGGQQVAFRTPRASTTATPASTSPEPQCRNRDTERHLAVMSPCFWRTSTSLMEEILHRLIAAMQPMKMGRLSISSGTGFLPSTASLQIICFKAFGNQKKLLEAAFVALAWLYGGGLHVPHLWKRMPRKSLFLHRPSMCRRKFSLKRHPKPENFETWNCSLSRGLQLQFLSGSRRARSAWIPGNGSSCTGSLSGWHLLSTCSNMKELQNFKPSSSHSSHSSHSSLNLHTWLLGSHSQLATEACAGRCGLSGQRLHRWSVAQALWASDRISCHVERGVAPEDELPRRTLRTAVFRIFCCLCRYVWLREVFCAVPLFGAHLMLCHYITRSFCHACSKRHILSTVHVKVMHEVFALIVSLLFYTIIRYWTSKTKRRKLSTASALSCHLAVYQWGMLLWFFIVRWSITWEKSLPLAEAPMVPEEYGKSPLPWMPGTSPDPSCWKSAFPNCKRNRN